MKKLKNQSVFFRYLISYSALIFVAGLLFILFSLFYSINEVNRANKAKDTNCMNMAVVDLENQLSLMKNITYKIRSNALYSPDYFTRKKYYELELLNDLRNYNSYSPLVEEYFIYYARHEYVYRSIPSVNTVKSYFSTVLRIDDWESQWNEILSASSDSIFYSKNAFGDYLFFTFPFNKENSAVMVFVVRLDDLQKRIKMLTGVSIARMDLYYRQQFLFSTMNSGDNPDGLRFEDTANTFADKSLIFTNSAASDFKLIVKTKQGTDDVIIAFQKTSWLIICLIMGVLLLSSILLSYNNYKPIQKLYAKLSIASKSDHSQRNELKSIEMAFEQIKTIQRQHELLIQQQLDTLKQQMIDIIITDGLTEDMCQKAREMGLLFEKPCYNIIALEPHDNMTPAVAGIMHSLLAKGLRPATSDSICFYIGSLNDNQSCRIVSNFDDSITLVAVAEHLRHILLDLHLGFRVGLSPIFRNDYGMRSAALEAYSALSQARKNGREEVFFFEINGLQDQWGWYSYEWPMKIARAIHNGEAQPACDIIHEVMDQLLLDKSSVVFQQYIFSDLLTVMVRVAHELSLAIEQNMVSGMLNVQTPLQYQEQAAIMIKSLCRARREQISKENVHNIQDIKEFIQEHYCDYDMGLDTLSGRFGYSSSRISHMIKDTLKESFKDYLISLRIDRAKKLLIETNLPIAMISEQVGYNSVSHFIKIFKHATGNIPSYYRK